MSRDWESVLRTWAKGPSDTEQERAANAERQVRQAIADSPQLQRRNIHVFTQGSYRNRVNVRQDSDVDVGVLCLDTFFPDYEDDNVKAIVEAKLEPATYTYASFKNELHQALNTRFSSAAVHRGNKAFDIKANSYRVEADVAAFFEHRRYTSSQNYHSGVQLLPDNQTAPLRNWPEQHYQNGVTKNNNTGRRYKRAVRILKHLRNEMADNGHGAADPISSFLIECLVWNVPNDRFDHSDYLQIVRLSLAYLFDRTVNQSSCGDWGEVSELKYLFRPSQPWSLAKTNLFLDAAWNYIGFK